MKKVLISLITLVLLLTVSTIIADSSIEFGYEDIRDGLYINPVIELDGEYFSVGVEGLLYLSDSIQEYAFYWSSLSFSAYSEIKVDCLSVGVRYNFSIDNENNKEESNNFYIKLSKEY